MFVCCGSILPLIHSGTPPPYGHLVTDYGHFFVFFSDTNVGVVSFSSSARTEISFTSRQNVEIIKSIVRKMDYDGGSTRMDLGLKETREVLFSKQGEMRKNMPDVLLAITDGKSNQGEKMFMSNRLDS